MHNSTGNNLHKKLQVKHLSFKIDGKQCIISHDRIVFLTGHGKNTIIHTNEKDYEIQRLLKQIESNLPENLFCRIHKKHIVNMKFLSNIEYQLGGQYLLYLNDPDDTMLPVGKIYAQKLGKKLDHL
jgi:DNA-binding LytR/AlgR family response regulator